MATRMAAVLACGLIAVACGTPTEDSDSSGSAQTECVEGDPVCGGGGIEEGEDAGRGGAANDSGAAAIYCSPGGATCAGASECCSGICNGTCASGASDSGVDGGLTPPPPPPPSVPQCKKSGDDCNDDKDCCSAQCWFSSCILG